MLYQRIVKQGTVNEPDGKPDPQYALPSTVNWMKALALLVAVESVSFSSSKAHYNGIGKRTMTSLVENTVFEQLFLGLHHLSALEKIKGIRPGADVARIGVLAWYYGIANAASAMIAAQNGSFQESHAHTAAMWDLEIAASGLALGVFGWRVSSLLENAFKSEVDAYRSGGTGNLLVSPITTSDAIGAAAGYLSGSAKWYAWQAADDVRRTKEFKALKVKDFRTKAAMELRNTRLSKRSVGFLHQASRYRGKANYREALFLAYGRSVGSQLDTFVADQTTVLQAFLAMAGAFASRKLGKSLWDEFVADVDTKRAFSLNATSVWT